MRRVLWVSEQLEWARDQAKVREAEKREVERSITAFIPAELLTALEYGLLEGFGLI